MKPDLSIKEIAVDTSTSLHDQFIMIFPEYEDAKQVNLDYFLELFQLDMEMFRYGYNRGGTMLLIWILPLSTW